jgi:hypothetical protein
MSGCRVEVDGEQFLIDGELPYDDVTHRGRAIDGNLLGVRAAQAIFDDANSETVDRWAYPDTSEWDPDRNVSEFCRAVPNWYEHGVRFVSINLQGGRPVRAPHEGGTDDDAEEQPWEVSAFRPDGTLKPTWLDRLEQVLELTADLGMAVIVGYFYFGQTDALTGDEAFFNATANATQWLVDEGYEHVIVEVANEAANYYDVTPLKPWNIHELIEHAQQSGANKADLPVGTSFSPRTVTPDETVAVSDLIMMHTNGVEDPATVTEMVETVRSRPSYEPMPVVFNEDSMAMIQGPETHYGFGREPNNMSAALDSGASWGYYEKGTNDYETGFQCPPIDWSIGTERKRTFFEYLAQLTDSA